MYIGPWANRSWLLGLVRSCYGEKATILDGDGDTGVNQASNAYQIWKNATERFPELEGACRRFRPPSSLGYPARALVQAS